MIVTGMIFEFIRPSFIKKINRLRFLFKIKIKKLLTNFNRLAIRLLINSNLQK